MPNVNLWGWDTPNTAWVKVLVDEDGHLKVDTLSSALPTGAATEATLADVESAVDGIEVLLAGGLPTVLDTDSLKVREQGTPEVLCQGWDGAAWQNLLVEDATNFNLRVKLYDGADALTSGSSTTTHLVPTALHGLDVRAIPYIMRSATSVYPLADSYSVADGGAGLNFPPVGLMGWDGGNWDRLRTYGTGVLKVGKGNIGATLVRKTVIGSVVAGPALLHEICINPSAASAVVEFTDAIIAAQPLAWDMFFTARETHHFVFDPPIPFTTGIYLETLTAVTSIMLCYTT